MKLDMSLVRGIDGSLVRKKLVGAFSVVCREMGVKLIGEGVETYAERDTLLNLGCELQQGYLFARPGRPFPTVDWR